MNYSKDKEPLRLNIKLIEVNEITIKTHAGMIHSKEIMMNLNKQNSGFFQWPFESFETGISQGNKICLIKFQSLF
jgi:hypothetical protein